MATIVKRKNADGCTVYRVQVRLKGSPTVSRTFERLTDARKWSAATESAIREGRDFGTAEAKRHTVAEMLERYEREVIPRKGSWSEGQRIQLAWWKARLGAYVLADVSAAMITEARDALAVTPVKQGKTEKPRSAAAVNRYLAVLSHAFTVACNEWSWLEHNPVRKVSRLREPRGRVRFLDDAEREALLRQCKASRNPALHDVVLLAICTGMRRDEILSLTWDAVNLHRRVIVLEKTKNDERRAVPLVGTALDMMRERSRMRRIDTPLVFPGRRRPDGAKPVSIQNAWKAALKRAGITDFTFHDLRHTAASYLAMSGATLPEIAAILGHKTLAMVQRYAHLSDAHTSKVVERMNNAIFAGESVQREEGKANETQERPPAGQT